MEGNDGDPIEGQVEVLTESATKRNIRMRKNVNGGALDYVPTPNEQALLTVLLDPYHRMASVTRQCELAGVRRETYYRAFKNEAFVDYYREMLNGLIKAQGGQLINIGIREARKGSFPHWKVLLEMGGFYNGDKKDINVDGEIVYTMRFVDPDDVDD